jgi:hypothetical protein
MANATSERNTVKGASTVNQRQNVLNMPAGAIAHFGTMKSADANQRAVNPGAAGGPVMGVVKKTIDNSTGGADAKKVELESGEFVFGNAGDIGIGDIGKPCFAVDNQTLTKVNTNSRAGTILEVHADGTVEAGIGPQYYS